MPDTGSKGRDTGSNYARFIGLGFTFVAILVVSVVVGFFADRLLGTLPLFLLLGLVAGFVGALYYVYRALETLGGR